MNEFLKKILRSRWRLLLMVGLAGLFLGVLLGRVLAYSLLGDLLTMLALIVIGLCVGATLFVIGWVIGTRGSKHSSENALGGELQAANANASAVATALSTSQPRSIALGRHIQFSIDEGKGIIRARNIFGYESFEVSFKLNRGWLQTINWRKGDTLAWMLFVASLAIYNFTRLFALDQFPINFFADEANQVLNGVDLFKHGFRDSQGQLFPMYIQLFSFYYPDIAVYLHALTSNLFGMSIVVARSTSAILTIPLAAALGLVLKSVFRARYWWAIVLLLTITPVWLLWSRTAFDPTAMAALYGLFISFYLLYRYQSARYIFLAVIFGAATFYAYPSAQPAVGLLALFLLISDFRYHLQHRRMWIGVLPLVLLAVIPFVRFYFEHPNETASHLHAVNSYLLQDVPVFEKAKHWVAIYLQILSPTYWFLPNQPDLFRHVLKDYGFLPLIELPLFLIGAILCLRYIKESKYRALLAMLMVAPVGAAITDPAIIRELAFVAPATIIGAVGLEWLLARIKETRTMIITAVMLFSILGTMSLLLLQDALMNGPTWFSDYTLYGMQWGAKQVFQDTIPQLVEENPGAQIYVSDTWANGTDVFLRFFNVDRSQVQMGNVSAWLQKKLPLDADAIFVMTPDEYEKAQSSPKFRNVEILNTIKYPDGRDGFYIARLEYADNIDEVFATEREALRQLVTDTVTINGEAVQLAHTKFDIGEARSMFDGDSYTVARGIEANPLILDFKFSTPRDLKGLDVYLGRSNSQVTASLYKNNSVVPLVYTSDFTFAASSTELPAGPLGQMNFDQGVDNITRLRLEIGYPGVDESVSHVHVFELKFR